MTKKAKIGAILGSLIPTVAVVGGTMAAAVILTEPNPEKIDSGYEIIINQQQTNDLSSILMSSLKSSDVFSFNYLNSSENKKFVINQISNFLGIPNTDINDVQYSLVKDKPNSVDVEIIFKESKTLDLNTNDNFKLVNGHILKTINPYSTQLPILISATQSNNITKIINNYIEDKQYIEEVNNPANIEQLKTLIFNETTHKNGDVLTNVKFELVNNNEQINVQLQFNNLVEYDGKEFEFVVVANGQNNKNQNQGFILTLKSPIFVNIWNDVSNDINLNYEKLSDAIYKINVNQNIKEVASQLSNINFAKDFFEHENEIFNIPSNEISIVQCNAINDGTVEFKIKFSKRRFAVFDVSITNELFIIKGRTLTSLNTTGLKNAEIDLTGYSIDEFAPGCFESNDVLTTITIPASLKSISPRAFKQCSKLNTVNFETGNQLTEISNEAFLNCQSLMSFTFTENLVNIGERAFSNTKLNALDFDSAKSLKTIGKRAFENIDVYTLNFPASLVSIDDEAFRECNSVNYVGFEENSKLEYIGLNVFSNDLLSIDLTPCVNLTESQFVVITDNNKNVSFKKYDLTKFDLANDFEANFINNKLVIPSGISSIVGEVPQQYKAQIQSIDFGDNNLISSISENAFKGCTQLNNVVIPSSVITIGNSAFDGCTGLTELSVAAGSNLQEIGNYVFRGCSFQMVDLQTNLTSVGVGAFASNTSLTSISLPNNITYISDNLFEGCTSLNNVTLPNKATQIGMSAFKRCTNLNTITIPASVEAIGSDAFSSFNTGETVTFEENSNLRVIGANTFKNNITIDLNNCTKLTKREYIQIIDNNPNAKFIKNEYSVLNFDLAQVTEADVTGGVLEIPNSYDRVIGTLDNGIKTTITSVDFGEYSNITSIGNNAFKDCTNLQSVEIPGSIVTIGSGAFQGCSKLKNVVVPTDSLLTTIGNDAFNGCSVLTEFYLPTKINTIGNGAFQSCAQLSSIIFPSSLVSIGDNAFQGCGTTLTGNTNFVVGFAPESTISSIGINAFKGCTKLTTITIPKTVTTIGNGGFEGCNTLQNVYFETGSVLSGIQDQTFMGCSALAEIGIKAENKTELPSTITAIGASAFKDCVALPTINLPISLTSIGNNAFESCKKLTQVNIPANVVSMGNSVFAYCGNKPNGNSEPNYVNGVLSTVIFEPGSKISTLTASTFDNFVNKSSTVNIAACKQLSQESIAALKTGLQDKLNVVN